MPLSRNLASYRDVRAVLAEAVKHRGGRYTLDSPQAAVRWRQRAYYFRKLEENPDLATMVLRLDGPVVVIEFEKLEGVFVGADGTQVDVEPANEFDEEAARLRAAIDSEGIEL